MVEGFLGLGLGSDNYEADYDCYYESLLLLLLLLILLILPFPATL